jgi:RNA polymerase sigma factor (sigma-70 family)
MVLGLCRLLLRDPIEAEDAAQQVFLSAHRSVLGGVAPREPGAWLATIARNECRARIRSRMRRPLELSDLPANLADPLAHAIDAADLDAFWVALSALPRRQRRAFLLRELGGLSYGELGAALGVSRPAVESLLFRARQQLRDALAGANVALAPLALRDQLVRLIPGFAPPTSPVPVAAKVAAVAVGVSLGAAGAVELPKHHGHAARPAAELQEEQAPAAIQREHDEAPLAAVTNRVTPVTHARDNDERGHGRSDDARAEERRHEQERGEARHEREDHRGREHDRKHGEEPQRTEVEHHGGGGDAARGEIPDGGGESGSGGGHDGGSGSD